MNSKSSKKRAFKKKLKVEIDLRNRFQKLIHYNLTRPLNIRPKHWLYDSKQWRELRYKTLRKYGFRCMACKTSESELHVDHIKPHSKYPELAFIESNLQVLCKDCNLGKSNIYEDDFTIDNVNTLHYECVTGR